jgi:peptide/nickel transport system permease protein
MPGQIHASHYRKNKGMESDQQQQSRYRPYVWKHFKRNKSALVSLYVLAFLTIVALLAPLLANDRPLYVRYHGQNFFPAFSLLNNYQVNKDSSIERIQLNITDWKKFPAEKIIYAPVPYSPGKSDYYNSRFISPSGEQISGGMNGDPEAMPLRFRHWLGTGQRGDDLLSGLIHGTRISLTIGFMSMGIATLIGILMGAFAGFFGDDKLTSSRGRFYFTMIGLLFAWFYGFQIRTDALTEGLKNSSGDFIFQFILSVFIFFSVTCIFSWVGKIIGKLPMLNKKMMIPAHLAAH